MNSNTRNELEILLKNPDFLSEERYMLSIPKKYKEDLRIKDHPDNKCHCFCYTLKSKSANKHSILNLIGNTELIKKIKPGNIIANDIVLYFSKNIREPLHIGRIIDKNLVESKWNLGPVLEHPIWLVPTSFGDREEYYRIVNQSQALKFMESSQS